MPPERAEIARAQMLELFPEGFEERELSDGIELAAYTDAGGEERLWAAFGTVSADAVPADWEERWREFHRPVQIGSLWIGPPWEAPPAGTTAVVIDPGRAFGTGGHATTRLCLELLAGLGPTSLADVGCGSGVISIAAAKLGFAPVFAIDDESTARRGRPAERGGERRRARAHPRRCARRRSAAGRDPGRERLGSIRAALRLHAETRGVIASGYLESERPTLPGFRTAKRRAAEGWAADLLFRE